ncbi:MAG TPA: hypothetical protein PK455_03995 [Caldisericia bacterium]|nr:hypothetical protein [Caldisericia bacterium]
MKEVKNLSLISFILILVLLITIFTGFRAELANNQRLFMVSAGVFLIIFGFITYLETKIKWLEKEKRKS